MMGRGMMGPNITININHQGNAFPLDIRRHIERNMRILHDEGAI
jgi:hypothetical protein